LGCLDQRYPSHQSQEMETSAELGNSPGRLQSTASAAVNQNTMSPAKDSQEKLNRWLKKAQSCKNSELEQSKRLGESDRIEDSKGPHSGPYPVTSSKEYKDVELVKQDIVMDKENAKIESVVSQCEAIEQNDEAHTDAITTNFVADSFSSSNNTKKTEIPTPSNRLSQDNQLGGRHAADITPANVDPHATSTERTECRRPPAPAPGDLPSGPPRKWSVAQVRAWLLQLGLSPAVSARFEEEEIGGEALLVLRAPELAELGVISLGPRTVLLSRIRELKMGRSGCRVDLPLAEAMAGVDVARWLAAQGLAEGVVQRLDA
jgi:hypothetical protein